MKYKVGDKVRVKKDLKAGVLYGSKTLATGMLKYCGKEATITKVLSSFYTVTVDNESWSWTEKMLEPVSKYKVGDRVIIRKDLEANKRYGIEVVVDEMLECAGHTAIITNVLECKKGIKYNINISCWSWTEEMFEPTVDCGFKVGDKVIFNPADKDKLTGVFTVSEIDTDLGIPYIKLKEMKECMWFNPNRFLKVPLFKVGDVVTLKNIEDDKYFYDTSTMRSINGQPGMIMGIKENRYTVDKPGQDGCQYEVKQFRTRCSWFVTSASLELVPAIAKLDDIKVTAANDPETIVTIGTTTTTAEALAQAVDSVKAPRFKIGDKVVIRDDLVPEKEYREWDYSTEDGLGGWEFAADMAKYRGKVATITSYVEDDPHYCSLDIDKGEYSWVINALVPYMPGSDYDLDRTVITNKQQTKQNNYENRLQEKGPVIAGRERQSGCAVRYPGEQIRVGISNLGYRKVTCKR